MSLSFPMTAGEANQLISNIITRTRPVSTAELYQALNYGVQKAVRAISASRPQFFASWVEPFSIGGGVTEYDVSGLSPSLFRPWRLVCNGNQGSSSVVLFKYASITTQEYEEAEVSTSGAVANQLIYDVLDGLLPVVVGAPVELDTPAGFNCLPITMPGFVPVAAGSILIVPNLGNAHTPSGWTSPVADDLTLYVTGQQLGWDSLSTGTWTTTASSTSGPVFDADGFNVGDQVYLTETGVPTEFVRGTGTIQAIAGNVVTINPYNGGIPTPGVTSVLRPVAPTFQPALPIALPAETLVTVARRRVLKIVPALQQTYTGRLWYVYTPPRLRQDGDFLPISLADRHIDMVVSYAVGLLKRAVDDSMENRWALEATEMRSELMQDTEPVSGQNSEALGSALDWIGY